MQAIQTLQTALLAAILIILTTTSSDVRAQFPNGHYDFFAQQNLITGNLNSADPRGAPHPAVVENALAEAQLPPTLLNPFYKNPAIVAGLAKESWFGHKEFPVHNREADKIPRSEILKIVKRLEDHRRK